jgi:cytoskeletal protein CcmA (bactofilin family)
MSEAPKRRLLDRVSGAAPTFIAEGCRVTGDIETAGAVVVCGSVRGDGKIGAALSMARDSAWEGEVHARHAVIAGTISGRLIVAEKLEIGSSAVLRADVVARSIAIAKGAIVEGAMQVTSGQPIVKFEEKRGAS